VREVHQPAGECGDTQTRPEFARPIVQIRSFKTLEEPSMTLLAPRRKTRVLDIGGVKIGGDNPIVVQTMATADTRDPKATLEQLH